MSLWERLRTVKRRLLGAVVALALSIGLAGLAAPAAHADPDRYLTVHDWDISDLAGGGQHAHEQYWNMIAAMHRVTGHDFFRDTLDETTTRQDALFQVSLHRNGNYIGALYFWPNDLYLAGFYQAGPNGGHYAFNEGRRARFNAILGVTSNELPWNGNYTSLPSGGQDNRRTARVAGPGIDNALQQIGRANQLLIPGAPNGHHILGSALTTVIQATSEAARFGRIFDNIRYNILNHSLVQMGDENVALQQQWSNLSGWVYRALNNAGVQPFTLNTGTGIQRIFYSYLDVIRYVFYMELASGSRPR
ncbi:ribosome-inactivating family protein [Streptomyces sp. NPDC002888]|uniref:ribosome-inactivating family protein n=1 Tax=Streptomyces sp. NPDC002888 TaxID=3364668 RepID=UPI0036A22475